MASATSANDNKRGWGRRFLPVAALAAGFCLFFALGLHRYLTFETLRAHRAELLAWVEADPAKAAAIYILVYTVIAAFSLPVATLASVTGGFLFGTILGAVYAVVGATLGGTILFVAARTAFHDLLRAKAGSAIQKMEQGFKKNAFSYLLVLRLVPLFPFFLVNLVPALLGVSLRVFVAATFIGIIPGALVFASVGNGLGAVFDAGRMPDLGIVLSPPILLPIIGLALLALLPVAYKRLRKKT
jgi:uncharacterized membrane protein YdjX (TVP38/TMEM64 family)